MEAEMSGTDIEDKTWMLWALYERMRRSTDSKTLGEAKELRRLLEDTAFLWTVQSQVHPHVAEAIDSLAVEHASPCLGLEWDDCDATETCGMADTCIVVKALLDAERGAAFWREKTFKPCEEVYATRPTKPTCPMLRDIKREADMCKDGNDFLIWLRDLLKWEDPA